MSNLLDVVIGLAFIFLVFSLLVSAVHEAGSRALGTRSKNLWNSLHELLDASSLGHQVPRKARTTGAILGLTRQRDKRPTPVYRSQDQAEAAAGYWTDQLYRHPLVRKLDDTRSLTRSRLSHIEPNDFSRALLDLVLTKGGSTNSADTPTATDPQVAAEETAGTQAAIDIRQAIAVLKATGSSAPFLKDLEVLARQTQGDVERLKIEVDQWFDARMDALSRAYRKRTRWWLFALGLVVAVGFNVEALHATQALYREDALRDAVAAEATQIVNECGTTQGTSTAPSGTGTGAATSQSCLDTKLGDASQRLQLPVGWKRFSFTWLTPIGWLITAAALAQGGPFWFDLLRQLTGIRKNR
jgi:hypothetical protein